MIVVDTQVIVHWTFPGQASISVDPIIERDGSWVAPTLWQSEFRNAVAGFVRQGSVTLDEAIEKAHLARSFVTSETVDGAHVLRLVSQSRCTAYDLEFVALAQQLGVSLVTNDRQILQAFPALAVTPATFASPDPSEPSA